MMALRQFSHPLIDLLYPVTSASPLRHVIESSALRRIHLPPALLPATTSIFTLPSLLGDIWESVLRAVPKKKPSYSKRRMRQMAGKALKDVTEIVKCPGCGRPKRMHIMCPYCIISIKTMLYGKEPPKVETDNDVEAMAK